MSSQISTFRYCAFKKENKSFILKKRLTFVRRFSLFSSLGYGPPAPGVASTVGVRFSIPFVGVGEVVSFGVTGGGDGG